MVPEMWDFEVSGQYNGVTILPRPRNSGLSRWQGFASKWALEYVRLAEGEGMRAELEELKAQTAELRRIVELLSAQEKLPPQSERSVVVPPSKRKSAKA